MSTLSTVPSEEDLAALPLHVRLGWIDAMVLTAANLILNAQLKDALRA